MSSDSFLISRFVSISSRLATFLEMTSADVAVVQTDEEEHHNWIKVGHYFRFMCEGLRPYITRKIHRMYNDILKNVRRAVCKCQGRVYHNCSWGVEIAKRHRRACPGSARLCIRDVNWENSISAFWTDPQRGPWEIAKLFMHPLKDAAVKIVNADTTDISGLLNLMCFCKEFNLDQMNLEKVRDLRNFKLVHNPNLQVTEKEMNEVFDSVMNVLQDQQLISDCEAKKALNRVKEFKEKDVLLKIQDKTVILEELKNESENTQQRKKLEEVQNKLQQTEEQLKRKRIIQTIVLCSVLPVVVALLFWFKEIIVSFVLITALALEIVNRCHNDISHMTKRRLTSMFCVSLTVVTLERTATPKGL